MSGRAEYSFAPTRAGLKAALDRLEAAAAAADVPPRTAKLMLLALDELIGNLMLHDPEAARRGDVSFRLDVVDGDARLTIADHGAPFDPFSDAVAPRAPGAGGLGLTLIRETSDEAVHRREGARNLSMLRYRLPKQ